VRNVTRGQLIPYTITISNVIGASMQGVQIVDRYPAGFRYVPGSAHIDGSPAEPTVAALQLVWNGISFGSSDHRTIVLLLAVGTGVGEGEFVNRAQVIEGLTAKPLSGEATATVRVVPDQTFDCTDVFGKVFQRHQSQRSAGRRRRWPAWRARGDSTGSGGYNGSVRAVSHHLRNHGE